MNINEYHPTHKSVRCTHTPYRPAQIPLPQYIRDATINDPMGDTVDYFAELYGLFRALALHANTPVDFLPEDVDAPTLASYSGVIVTEPNIPTALATKLLAYATAGGHVVRIGNAASADEYNTIFPPAGSLDAAMGIKRAVAPRQLSSTSKWSLTTTGSVELPAAWGLNATNGTSVGVRGGITAIELAAGSKAEVLMAFAVAGTSDEEGGGAVGPAVVRAAVGKGSSTAIAFWPGITYAYCGGCGPWCRVWATMLLNLTNVVPGDRGAAVIDHVCIETPRLSSATGDAITILKWIGGNISAAGATLNVTLGYTPTKVTSAASGGKALAHTTDATGKTTVNVGMLELGADVVSFLK